MRRRLRLCFSFIRRQGRDRVLRKACGPSSRDHMEYKNIISYHITSQSWSKIPLTSISECDEDLDTSVSSITESYSSIDDLEMETKPIPDFATVYSSSRLFFSAPGSSSSMIEPESTSSSSVEVARNSLAVETYSVNPYQDFKRSMQDMVEASKLMKTDSTAARWSFLHEMLLCYLALNHKSTHKLIIHAFADLLVNGLVDSDNGRDHRYI